MTDETGRMSDFEKSKAMGVIFDALVAVRLQYFHEHEREEFSKRIKRYFADNHMSYAVPIRLYFNDILELLKQDWEIEKEKALGVSDD